MRINTNKYAKKLNKITEIQTQILTIVGEVMIEFKEQIVGILVQQQQSEHVDSNNELLRPYSRNYARYKVHLGLGSATTLDLTGQFQGEMDLTVEMDKYFFNSPATTDTGELKSEWLNRWNKAKGGGDIMDLTPDNKAIVWQLIRPRVQERINNELALD